jgi:glycine hydroxymethyltransferase
MNGLRIGTPELVRWGVTMQDVDEIASLIARSLKSNNPGELAEETAKLRSRFQTLRHILTD